MPCRERLIYLCLINCIVLVQKGHSAKINFSNMQHFIGSGPAADKKMGFTKEKPCSTLEQRTLTGILGAAYNPRYMSVTAPTDPKEDNDPSDMKRMISGYRPFAVDEDFSQQLGEEEPAWETNHFTSVFFTKRKRNIDGEKNRQERAAENSTPWECKSSIRWTDLGSDYFPRYLRSVECSKRECWYGRYSCKPRSFTVKILRRKHGKCANHRKNEKMYDLPEELRELWVWEERAVNFCCECAP